MVGQKSDSTPNPSAELEDTDTDSEPQTDPAEFRRRRRGWRKDHETDEEVAHPLDLDDEELGEIDDEELILLEHLAHEELERRHDEAGRPDREADSLRDQHHGTKTAQPTEDPSETREVVTERMKLSERVGRRVWGEHYEDGAESR